MSLPKNLKYTKEHEWIEFQGDSATIGVTAYAVEQLGDIVHIDLPQAGKEFKAGDSFGTIESTKTVSDLYLPVAGKIQEVNSAVKSAPESLQQDIYKQGWLVKIKLNNAADANDKSLMSSEAYDAFIKE